jgi:hypothetical protein
MTRLHGQGATYLAAVIGGSALVLGMAPAAEAAITAYNDRAAFEAALAPGSYTESQMYSTYPNYAGGSGFSYTVGASGGPYQIQANDLMSSNSDPSSMVFNFGSGIKAFGGYFYNVNLLGEYVPISLQISLNGDSFVTTEIPSSAITFYGFISDSLLTDATIARSSDFYVTAGSVIVGTTASAPAPVATPGPLPLFGAAAAFGWSRRLRRRLVGGRPGC